MYIFLDYTRRDMFASTKNITHLSPLSEIHMSLLFYICHWYSSLHQAYHT